MGSYLTTISTIRTFGAYQRGRLSLLLLLLAADGIEFRMEFLELTGTEIPICHKLSTEEKGYPVVVVLLLL